MTDTTTCDVVVIDAGASGLTAAADLRAAGLDVVVLEARDRVGGRLRTETIDGAVLELGGQWVSPDQTASSGVTSSRGCSGTGLKRSAVFWGSFQ